MTEPLDSGVRGRLDAEWNKTLERFVLVHPLLEGSLRNASASAQVRGVTCEDLYADGMSIVWQRLSARTAKQILLVSNLDGYLWRAAHRAVSESLRRHQSRGRKEESHPAEILDTNPGARETQFDRLIREWEHAQQLAVILRVLHALPQRHRIVVRRCILDVMLLDHDPKESRNQVMAELKISSPRVSQILRDFFEKARTALDEWRKNDDE